MSQQPYNDPNDRIHFDYDMPAAAPEGPMVVMTIFAVALGLIVFFGIVKGLRSQSECIRHCQIQGYDRADGVGTGDQCSCLVRAN